MKKTSRTGTRTKTTAPSTSRAPGKRPAAPGPKRQEPYSTLRALQEARDMLRVVGFDDDVDRAYKRSWNAALKRIDGALKAAQIMATGPKRRKPARQA